MPDLVQLWNNTDSISRFTLDASLSLSRVAETLPFTFTGADLYALCSDAMLKAVTRSAQGVDEKIAVINQERASRGQPNISVANYFDHHATDTDTDIFVTEDDFVNAKQELVPSVSLDELSHYERVRNNFEGTTKQTGPEKKDSRPPTSAHLTDGLPPVQKPTNSMGNANGGRVKTPDVNGNSRFQADGGASDADDDDYVVRTDRLALNNNNN